jgi:hypothetical protein
VNAKNSNEEDARLSTLLNEWKPDSALPPRFQEEVWRRIAHENTAVNVPWWSKLWRSLDAAFRRPAMAVSYVAVLLMVGIGAGLWQAREKASQVDHILEARYLQSVDPYQKAR